MPIVMIAMGFLGVDDTDDSTVELEASIEDDSELLRNRRSKDRLESIT